MNPRTFSVVIPALNEERHLADCSLTYSGRTGGPTRSSSSTLAPATVRIAERSPATVLPGGPSRVAGM